MPGDVLKIPRERNSSGRTLCRLGSSTTVRDTIAGGGGGGAPYRVPAAHTIYPDADARRGGRCHRLNRKGQAHRVLGRRLPPTLPDGFRLRCGGTTAPRTSRSRGGSHGEVCLCASPVGFFVFLVAGRRQFEKALEPSRLAVIHIVADGHSSLEIQGGSVILAADRTTNISPRSEFSFDADRAWRPERDPERRVCLIQLSGSGSGAGRLPPSRGRDCGRGGSGAAGVHS